MDTINLLITASLPLIGVALGAVLQYHFSRSTESRKQLTMLRIEAYKDYLQCIAQSAHAGSDRNELFARAASAKTRICVYGSAPVLSALASFEKHGAAINAPESASTFLRLATAMRQESADKSEIVNTDDLRIVMFGDRDWET